MSVVLPFVFGNLSGAVPASDIDANFNVLAAAIDAIGPGTEPIAGNGININSGGTISFNPSGVALDGSTIGGNPLATAFLSLFNSGTTAQTVLGTVDFNGFVQTSAGISASRSVTWSGSTNYLNQNPSQAGISGIQYYGGTIAGSTPGGSPINGLVILDSLTAANVGGVTGFNIQHNFSGSSATGARTALQATLSITGPTGNPYNATGEYAGFEAYCQASGNDNGTSTNPSGVVFGINTVAQLGSTCTYWAGCVGYELDIGVDAGASVSAVYGMFIGTLPGHAVNGSQDDIALALCGNGSNQTAFWKVGLGFGGNIKPTSFGPSSTLIKVYPDVGSGTLTVANFIDLTPATVTITGNAWFSQGATISGTGKAAFLNVAWATASLVAAGTSQSTATAITAQDVVVTSGSGGVRLVNFNNGCECIIRNRVGATITIYPQSGAQIENAGTNVGLTLPNGTDGRFQPFSATQWYY